MQCNMFSMGDQTKVFADDFFCGYIRRVVGATFSLTSLPMGNKFSAFNAAERLCTITAHNLNKNDAKVK